MEFYGDWNEERSYPAVGHGEPWNGWFAPIVTRDTLTALFADADRYVLTFRPDGEAFVSMAPDADDVADYPDGYATLSPSADGHYALRDLGWTFVECDDAWRAQYGVLPSDLIVWTSGHNDASYSPDPDHISVWLSQVDARASCADDIDRLAEFIGDRPADDADDDAEIERLYRAAFDTAHTVRTDAGTDYAGEFSVAIDDGRSLPSIYWVNQSTVSGVFDTDTDSPEYGDLRAEYYGH